MNDKQLKLIAHSIALASGLSYNERIELEQYIIATYKELEDE